MVYDLYKPLRNYLRQYQLASSLAFVWLYSEHVINGKALPAQLRQRDQVGLPYDLSKMIHPWEFEILARELILNASGTERTLDGIPALFTAINRIRQTDNAIAGRRSEKRHILLQMHSVVLYQFPWQRAPHSGSMMRYFKIFSSEDLHMLLVEATGLTMREHFLLGLAVTGHFHGEPEMSATADTSEIGIAPEKAALFFDRLAHSSLDDLRAQAASAQVYDGSWMFNYNPLREKPLVRFDASRPHRLLCPLTPLLVRRISEGLFYDVVGMRGFESAFGFAFQNYVGEVMQAICEPPRFAVIGEQEYKIGKYRKDGVDWILEDETATLFVECKTKRLRHEAKFSSSEEGLDQALDAMAGYIVQHYKNILDAVGGRTHWVPNGRPSYALVVTLEDWFVFGRIVSGMLNGHIQRRMDEAGIDPQILNDVPFAIASIDEFETALQVITETGIARYFALKTDQEHREWAVSPFSVSCFGPEVRRTFRKLFAEEFDALMPDRPRQR